MAIDLFGFDSPRRICQTSALRREKARQRMAEKQSTAQGKERAKRASAEWRARNPNNVYNQRYREGQRRAIAAGREYKPTGKRSKKEIYSEELLYRNARDAFKFWFSKKTDEDVARWYAATGKPWLNPRLTKGEKHRVRYALDIDFRISEIGRLRLKKMIRKMNIKVASDGTVKSELIKSAKSCLYCGALFSESVIQTIDHLVPLSKGGTHSIANVVVCCKSCNSRKAGRDFVDWVTTLPDSNRKQSLRAWERLRGAPASQRALL